MGSMEVRQSALSSPHFSRGIQRCLLLIGLGVLVIGPANVRGQQATTPEPTNRAGNAQPAAVTSSSSMRARRFLRGRTLMGGASAAQAIDVARRQQAAMIAAQAASPLSNLNATWQPVGPSQVVSIAYGNVTGRVTSIAIDPGDASGNTVYVG